MRLPHAPVHGQRTLETAQMMVPGPVRERVSRIGANPLPKQRLQAIFFPEGLTFDGHEFGHQHVWLSNSCERVVSHNSSDAIA